MPFTVVQTIFHNVSGPMFLCLFSTPLKIQNFNLCYTDNHISDSEWKKNLEKAASNLAVSSVGLKIGRGTLDQIRYEKLFELR